MITFYAVKHAPTGTYLPRVTGRSGRGGSHVEPVAPNDANPRLFDTERAAKIYLNLWLKGKFVADRGTYYGHEGNADYAEEISAKPQPHRRREEMVVVVLNAIEVLP